jgi:outer membrane biosynthesis protein TonB
MKVYKSRLRCLNNWSLAGLAVPGLILSFAVALTAQQTATGGNTQSDAAQKADQSTAPPQAQGPAEDESKSEITEEELRRMLVGKPLFLRGGYLDDSLSFGLNGELQGKSMPAPFTLCAVQIDKVHLSKRKVELVGARYGLHFLGALAYEDNDKAVDRVRITPKKKSLKITIDRELVVKPKKVKEPKHSKKKNGVEEALISDSATGNAADSAKPDAPKPDAAKPDAAAAENAEIKPDETKGDSSKEGTTTSPAHSAAVLRAALERTFADSIDESMIKAMPDFWKFYYQAVAAKSDYRPADPAVLRQNMVDQKARLLTRFEPESNQFAQDHGVAGMSLYHVVIGADGTPGEIAVARPIGFGLDENAVSAIRAAKFEPAVKDGKPVPVLLDLVVQFRIYSKRTSGTGAPAGDKPPEPTLPGPYSVQTPDSPSK